MGNKVFFGQYISQKIPYSIDLVDSKFAVGAYAIVVDNSASSTVQLRKTVIDRVTR